MLQPKKAWIFDADGVITDIKQEKITQPLILESIIKILENEEPVAFNTGRGIDWVEKVVLYPLKNKISNSEILQNLFVVAEGGGVWATFNKDYSLNLKIDESVIMPVDLDQKVRNLVLNKYSKSMRYEDKKTMITTKIKEGYPIEEFNRLQIEMIKDLQKLIDDFDLVNELKVDISTIGTSIIHKTTGKDKGVELILEWLKEKGVTPKRFLAFGDSNSDIPMAEKIYESGYSVELVYVGKNELPKENYPFKVTKTKNKFTKGTLEFLAM